MSLGLPLWYIVWVFGVVYVFPDPEHLVDRVERVDLELVVRVAFGDEDL